MVTIKAGKRVSQVAILFCAILWSTSGLFIKIIEWHPLVIAGLRSLIAALFILLVRGLTRWGGTGGSFKAMLRSGPFWAAGFAYSATMILFVIANKMTASANAILLQYGAPIWAALLGWLIIGEKPRVGHWIALVMVMAGLFLFFSDGLVSGSHAGDLIAVLSGVCFGANSVFLRKGKDGDPAGAMLLAHVITALFCLPFLFIFPPSLSLGAIGALLFMGILQIGLASILFSYGIQRVRAVEAMLIAMIEPVLNPVWVLLVTGERPSPAALAGGAIIVTAVVVSSFIGGRHWRH
ncbi:MAG: DMT family transporter [Treponema sp.]|nr:DMT family transporter [Treponema sp.]